ncbi:MAG TPA: GNAT family N-acetyltransferase [Ktedonosporobacter sp.]|nr:GNAT family N-acetyltransferase [Ktedonosporobacter sp.]
MAQSVIPSESVITIREAVLADSKAIAAIIRAQGQFAHLNDEAYAQAHVAALLGQSRREQTNTVLVAELAGGEVVGYVAVHWFPNFLVGNTGYISELFIHPAATGKGIGGKLLDDIKEEAIRRGCVCLTLVNLRNRESYQRSFYAKHGWRERQEAANFILDLPSADKLAIE